MSENRRVDEVLSRRPLNRATLARQLLLERVAHGSVLADGLVSAVWRLERDGLVVSHVARLPKRVLASIAAKGRRLLRFLDADSSDVRLVALSP